MVDTMIKFWIGSPEHLGHVFYFCVTKSSQKRNNKLIKWEGDCFIKKDSRVLRAKRFVNIRLMLEGLKFKKRVRRGDVDFKFVCANLTIRKHLPENRYSFLPNTPTGLHFPHGASKTHNG